MHKYSNWRAQVSFHPQYTFFLLILMTIACQLFSPLHAMKNIRRQAWQHKYKIAFAGAFIGTEEFLRKRSQNCELIDASTPSSPVVLDNFFEDTNNPGYGAFSRHSIDSSLGNKPDHTVIFYETGEAASILFRTILDGVLNNGQEYQNFFKLRGERSLPLIGRQTSYLGKISRSFINNPEDEIFKNIFEEQYVSSRYDRYASELTAMSKEIGEGTILLILPKELGNRYDNTDPIGFLARPEFSNPGIVKMHFRLLGDEEKLKERIWRMYQIAHELKAFRESRRLAQFTVAMLE